jgi:uncharacterized protein YkvS
VFTTSNNYQTIVYDVKSGKEITQINGEIVEFSKDSQHIIMRINQNYFIVDTKTLETKYSFNLNYGYHSLSALIKDAFLGDSAREKDGNLIYSSDSSLLLIENMNH